jgi:hypothetical protein
MVTESVCTIDHASHSFQVLTEWDLNLMGTKFNWRHGHWQSARVIEEAVCTDSACSVFRTVKQLLAARCKRDISSLEVHVHLSGRSREREPHVRGAEGGSWTSTPAARRRWSRGLVAVSPLRHPRSASFLWQVAASGYQAHSSWGSGMASASRRLEHGLVRRGRRRCSSKCRTEKCDQRGVNGSLRKLSR